MRDCVVVGAGIQGLVTHDKLRKRKIDSLCIGAAIGGLQTIRSQFYLHRGHFYQELEMVETLNKIYNEWHQLVKNMELKIYHNCSYVGFKDSSEQWRRAWDIFKIPYKKDTIQDKCFQKNKIKEMFSFPHFLFNGNELIEKLYNKHKENFLISSVLKIDKKQNYYTVYTENGEKITTKSIILAAGEANDNIVKNISIDRILKPKIQKRFCQIMQLKGNLPNLSFVVPDAKMFIAPQYDGNDVKWLYTYDTDTLIKKENILLDEERIKRQKNILLETIPGIRPLLKEISIFTAKKIESESIGNGKRPNKPFVQAVTKNIIYVLPTKLTFANLAANLAINLINI